jgi:hypothetical protein
MTALRSVSHFGRTCGIGKRALEIPDPFFRVVLRFHGQMLPLHGV